MKTSGEVFLPSQTRRIKLGAGKPIVECLGDGVGRLRGSEGNDLTPIIIKKELEGQQDGSEGRDTCLASLMTFVQFPEPV